MTAAEKLERYMTAMEEELLNSVNSPLVQLQLAEVVGKLWEKDENRAYLAMRNYLLYPPPNKTGTLEDNWAYTEAQANRYLRSRYFQTTVQPVLDQINTSFRNLNRTYQRDRDYGVSTVMEPRLLSQQLGNWLSNYDPTRDRANTNKNGIKLIHNASQDLKTKLLAEIVNAKYDNNPGTGTSLAEFKKFLTGRTTSPPQALTFATPGLSDHGTGRAFDFVIPGAVGTEANAASITRWQSERWAEQLNTAIRAVDPRATIFKGPLGTAALPGPNEPWHYYYLPVPPREFHQ